MTQPAGLEIVTRFKPLTDDNVQLYKLHQKDIEKKIRETFPSIPSNFQLKPVSVCVTQTCGTSSDYKVAVPDQKFATVSFHTGGLQASVITVNEKFEEQPAPKPQGPIFTVEPQLTSTPDW